MFPNHFLSEIADDDSIFIVACAANKHDFGWHKDTHANKFGAVIPLYQACPTLLEFRINKEVHSFERTNNKLLIIDSHQTHRLYNPTPLHKMTTITALVEIKDEWQEILNAKGIDAKVLGA